MFLKNERGIHTAGFWLFLAGTTAFSGAVFQAVSIRFLTYVFPFQMLFAISLISCLAIFFTGAGAIAAEKLRNFVNPLIAVMAVSYILSAVLINLSGSLFFMPENPVFASILFTSVPLITGGTLTGICYREISGQSNVKLKYLITLLAVAFFAGYILSAYLFTSIGIWNVFIPASIISALPFLYNRKLIAGIVFLFALTVPLFNAEDTLFKYFALQPHLWEEGESKLIKGFWSPYSRLDFYEMSDGRLAGLYNRAQQWAVGDPQFDIPLRKMLYDNLTGDVLVVGSGGGYGLLSLTKASTITAVELDSGVVNAMKGPLSSYNRNIYNKIEQVYAGDGRAFLDSTDKTFDVVIFEAADLSYSTTPHSFISIENYLYTVEGIEQALNHLKKDGIFIILVTKELIPAPKFINALPAGVQWRLFEGHVSVMKNIPMNFDFIVASNSSEKISWWEEYLNRPELKLNPVMSSELYRKSSFGVAPITDNRPLLYFRDWSQAIPFFVLLALLITVTVYLIMMSKHRISSTFFSILGMAFMTAELYIINSMRAYLGGYLETASFLLGVLVLGTAFGTFFHDRIHSKYLSVLILTSMTAMMLMLFYAPLSFPVYLKLLWITVAIGPAAFFMGTLFPKALISSDKENISLYYAIDTIGASTGLVIFYLLILAGGFYLAGASILILYSAALFFLRYVLK